MKKLLLILIVLLLSSCTAQQITQKQVEQPTQGVELTLSKANLAEMLDRLPFQHRDIIYQIIILESGHLKSYLTTAQNNISGMRCCKSRKNMQNGCSSKQYGIYDDWRDCVYDLLLWEQQMTKNKKFSKAAFYKLLNSKYNKNSDYVTTLKKIRVPAKLIAA